MQLGGNNTTATSGSAIKPKKPKGSKSSKKFGISLGVMIVGLVALVVGVVFLVLNILREPETPDGEYLVSATEWVMDGEPKVIWNFTEVGKGTLTTNGHTNDYDFIWALKDDRLQIETNWLYELENAYTYRLDKETKQLILTEGDRTITFTGKFKE